MDSLKCIKRVLNFVMPPLSLIRQKRKGWPFIPLSALILVQLSSLSLSPSDKCMWIQKSPNSYQFYLSAWNLNEKSREFFYELASITPIWHPKQQQQWIIWKASFNWVLFALKSHKLPVSENFTCFSSEKWLRFRVSCYSARSVPPLLFLRSISKHTYIYFLLIHSYFSL